MTTESRISRCTAPDVTGGAGGSKVGIPLYEVTPPLPLIIVLSLLVSIHRQEQDCRGAE